MPTATIVGNYEKSRLAEGMTGLALLLAPSFVGRLLLGEAFTGVGIVSGRVAGIALIALGPVDK